jgi:cell division protein FtsX
MFVIYNNNKNLFFRGLDILGIFRKKYKLLNFYNKNFWNRFFLFVIAVVVWLGFVSIMASGILEKILDPINFANGRQIFIEIYPESVISNNKYRKDIVVDFLSQSNMVENFQVVEEKEILEITKSFVSFADFDSSKMPFPTIISAILKNEVEPITLEKKIQDKVKNVYVETEIDAVKKLALPFVTARFFSLLIPIISIGVMVAIIFLIILALLYSHKDTIEILSFLGARNITVALEFANWIFFRTLIATLFGIILGMVFVIILIASFNIADILRPSIHTMYLIGSMVVVCPLFAYFFAILCVNKFISRIIN